MNSIDLFKYFDNYAPVKLDMVGLGVTYTIGSAAFNTWGDFSNIANVNALMISIPMSGDDHETQAKILKQAFKNKGIDNFLYGHNGRFYLEKKLLPSSLQDFSKIPWLRDCHRSAVVRLSITHKEDKHSIFDKIKHESRMSILFHKDFLTTEEILERKTYKLSKVKNGSDARNNKDTSKGSAFPININSKVYFLTAKHVLKDFGESKIELKNLNSPALYGQIGKESKYDAQLVDIQNFSGETFEVSRLELCELGDEVYVAGFPGKLGDTPTISLGHISKLNADYDDGRGLIQISSAAVNPNNSGGPVTDYQGNVIGILVMRADPNKQYQNIAFVEPIERVIEDLDLI